MKVEAEMLARLLEVQKLDSEMDRLNHRRANLAEQSALDKAAAELDEINKALGDVKAELSQVAGRQAKFDRDIEIVNQKISTERALLNSGDVSSPRELSAIQAEVESLERRKSGLEDQDLEVMQEAETLNARVAAMAASAAALEADVAGFSSARDAAAAGIDSELSLLAGRREEAAGSLDTELLALYEELRATKGGVGAAELTAGACGGCRMKLPAQELSRIRRETGLVRCVECNRILVIS